MEKLRYIGDFAEPEKRRMLVLENGRYFIGKGFGSPETRIAEIVFNTSMVGYQEILSDPSYCGQMVVMSYPLIGNYGLADEDYESKGIYMSGFIVREYNDSPTNFRFTKTLSEVMFDNGAAGISQVDTREIVRLIRNEGAMRAMITDAGRDVAECVAELKAYSLPHDQVSRVSSKNIWYSRTKNPEFNVVVVDCGVKLSMIKKLNAHGANVVVVPYNTPFEEVMRFKPDGLFISNGPGDPEDVPEVRELIKTARGKLPIMGICLGHQIIGLAYGARTYKMKFGHRGGNHPVKDMTTGKVEITSQNHSYAIDKSSLEGTGMTLTHINLTDSEPEGMLDEKNSVISIQYHPESAAGPEDSDYLFDSFIGFLKKAGGGKHAKENRY